MAIKFEKVYFCTSDANNEKYSEEDNKKIKYIWDKVKAILHSKNAQKEYEHNVNKALNSQYGYNPVSNLENMLLARVFSSLGIKQL